APPRNLRREDRVLMVSILRFESRSRYFAGARAEGLAHGDGLDVGEPRALAERERVGRERVGVADGVAVAERAAHRIGEKLLGHAPRESRVPRDERGELL